MQKLAILAATLLFSVSVNAQLARLADARESAKRGWQAEPDGSHAEGT
jgi:hypothetical protein